MAHFVREPARTEAGEQTVAFDCSRSQFATERRASYRLAVVATSPPSTRGGAAGDHDTAGVIARPSAMSFHREFPAVLIVYDAFTRAEYGRSAELASLRAGL